MVTNGVFLWEAWQVRRQDSEKVSSPEPMAPQLSIVSDVRLARCGVHQKGDVHCALYLLLSSLTM